MALPAACDAERKRLEDPDRAGPFAPFVTTLGRGPGRSRALTRDEASQAFTMVLNGEPDPIQVGAFLMLLRYRGEDPDGDHGSGRGCPRLAAG